MNLLTVAGIARQAEQGFALGPISFTQQRSRRLAITGETGSGKSTLLKIIAGLVQPGAGTVAYAGIRVKGPDEQLIPGHPLIAYLSQHYELRNHYRVEELLDMASKLPDKDAADIYGLCRISHLLKRRTDQLSGGERQRIALARLLTSSPGMLLLDEPFSNLDPIHKAILKDVLHDVTTQMDITCLLASHDPQDTLSWADQILVLKDGQLVQQGAPEDIYHRPMNEYVAGLFGKYNLIPAGQADDFSRIIKAENKGRQLWIRPEVFQVSIITNGSSLTGMVTAVSFWGSYYELEVALARTTITVRILERLFEPGQTVFVSLRPGRVGYI